jgi:hypothetical protein
VSSRLVLNELDLNLPSLAAGLVVIVVVVVRSGARSLGATTVGQGAIAIADSVVVGRRRIVLVVIGDLGGHGGQ